MSPKGAVEIIIKTEFSREFCAVNFSLKKIRHATA